MLYFAWKPSISIEMDHYDYHVHHNHHRKMYDYLIVSFFLKLLTRSLNIGTKLQPFFLSHVISHVIKSGWRTDNKSYHNLCKLN